LLDNDREISRYTTEFKSGTRSEEHNRNEHNALTVRRMRIRGTYTCNSSGFIIRYI
jgi:hypothetical protein